VIAVAPRRNIPHLRGVTVGVFFFELIEAVRTRACRWSPHPVIPTHDPATLLSRRSGLLSTTRDPVGQSPTAQERRLTLHRRPIWPLRMKRRRRPGVVTRPGRGSPLCPSVPRRGFAVLLAARAATGDSLLSRTRHRRRPSTIGHMTTHHSANMTDTSGLCWNPPDARSTQRNGTRQQLPSTTQCPAHSGT